MATVGWQCSNAAQAGNQLQPALMNARRAMLVASAAALQLVQTTSSNSTAASHRHGRTVCTAALSLAALCLHISSCHCRRCSSCPCSSPCHNCPGGLPLGPLHGMQLNLCGYSSSYCMCCRCCCCSCILAVICGMTLLMTSCRDPGILPRQEPDEEWLQARKPRCAGTAITACSVHTHAAQQCTLPLHAAHAAMQAMSTAVNAGTVRSTHSHVAHQHSSARCTHSQAAHQYSSEVVLFFQSRQNMVLPADDRQ